MKKTLLIFTLILTIISCKKADAICGECLTFYYEKPQPENDSELTGFPARFKGVYKNKDSVLIRIEEDRILEEFFYKFKIHKSLLDSLKQEYKIVNNQLINEELNQKMDMYPKGDSLELVRKDIDTLFRFSYNQKAKRIAGQLVLSSRDSVLWQIRTISLEKGILKIKYIDLPDDLKKLDSVTVIKGKKIDSTSYLIKPTRREFKSILKIKNLGTDNEYKKL